MGVRRKSTVSGSQHPQPLGTGPSAQPLKARGCSVQAAQLHLGRSHTTATPSLCTNGNTRSQKQRNRPLQTALGAIFHQLLPQLPQAPSGHRSSEPRAVLEARSFPQLYPSLCSRQELQHKALQSVGAPDTRYTLCEQRGHQRTFKSSLTQAPS